MKTAFITGATGFLGSHLCNQLQQQGWQVTALCRRPQPKQTQINWQLGNLLDSDSLLQAIPQQTDVLFHLAADTNTWQKNNPAQSQTNVTGTANIIQATVQKRVKKLLHVSSVVTFGVDHQGMANITENSPQHGTESWVNYVKSKSLAEQLAKAAPPELQVTVVNPTHIIGPQDQHNWIRLFKMIINDNLPAIPQGAGSFADVRDVAAGIILAAEQGKDRENYLLGGHNLSFQQFIDQVAQTFNCSVTAKKRPQTPLKIIAWLQSKTAYLTGNPPRLTPESLKLISHRYQVNSHKAKTELNYQITPLNQTLQAIKQDLQQRKLLPPT